MSSEPSTVRQGSDLLAANELQLLADMNLELADRYERNAVYMESEEGRRMALTLARWRQRRGRYFRKLSAEAERTEAAHIEWARACLPASQLSAGRPSPAPVPAPSDLPRRPM